jgi:hypothetical protein
MSGDLKPPHPIARVEGREPFYGLDATVTDFWRWAFSDLRMNNVRGILAEFLVAKAVGANEAPKEEWANFDVQTPDGIRIEVKASAYWQSWPQRGPSKIVFSGLTARSWEEDGSYSADRQIRADVFVFAVQACADPTKYDPLDVGQWEFYVLPASTVAETGARSLSLASLARHEAGPIAWRDLAEAVAESGRVAI